MAALNNIGIDLARFLMGTNFLVICMCVYMYSFFYGTCTCASTNNLDSVMNSTFHASGKDLAGVALTITLDCSIAHTPWKKRKQIKRRLEPEREAKENEFWQPLTLNGFLKTYMSGQPHNNTEAAFSPAVAATGLLKTSCF